jgi:hypothetical protein
MSSIGRWTHSHGSMLVSHTNLSITSILFRWIDTITWWWSTRIETCSDNKNYVKRTPVLLIFFIAVLTVRNSYIYMHRIWGSGKIFIVFWVKCWRWRQHVPRKCLYPSTTLSIVITQKMVYVIKRFLINYNAGWRWQLQRFLLFGVYMFVTMIVKIIMY